MTVGVLHNEKERRRNTRPRRAFGDNVAAAVTRLQQGYLAKPTSLPWAVATLARLRRLVDHAPGSSYAVLEETQVPQQLLEDWAGDGPTPKERAKHAALALYATHQQSHRDDPMQVDGVTLGEAVYRLATKAPEEGGDPGARRAAVLRRFAALGTAITYPELLHHLRSLIRQLRDEKIGLDYGLLAEDLVTFQWPGGPDDIRARWGRDFYRNDAFGRKSTPEEER